MSILKHRFVAVAMGLVMITAANCSAMEDEDIRVLELRNYLLRPNSSEGFRKLFNEEFVQPMHGLGGHTVGQFRIDGVDDHFVWMRGYRDMGVRFKFLNDFYLNSEIWKKYRSDANSMIVNSDNVYLLRPLSPSGKLSETGISIKQSMLAKEKGVVVVDFYICNGQLQEGIDLVRSNYVPFLNSIGVLNITLWVSEMSENEFPRLPAFQDRNLLVTMTAYKDRHEYESAIKKTDEPDAELKNRMLEVITTRHRLVLFPTQTK